MGQSESKQKLEVMERTGLSQANLTMEEKIQLADLFIRFRGTWDRPDNAPVVHTDTVEFKLDLVEGTEPWKYNYRTRDRTKQQIEDRHIKSML